MWSAQGSLVHVGNSAVEHYSSNKTIQPILYSLMAEIYNGDVLIDKKSIVAADINRNAQLLSFRPQKMEIQKLSNVKLKLTDNTTYLTPSDTRLSLLIKVGDSTIKFSFITSNNVHSREGTVHIRHLYDGIDIIALPKSI
jgi:hypothetical protein